jgi:3-oxoacyl-[acyl-carrier protein] reductase
MNKPASGTSMNLAGRKALVTGGTRGIGAAIVSRLTAAGATVVRTATSLEHPATEANGIETWAVDFTSDKSTNAFLDRVAKHGFDVLVNNAGINKVAPFAEIAREDFDRIIQVNLRAPFLVTQAVLPGMLQQKWGRIVNISSIFGVVSRAHRASYSASKFGIDGITAALAAEVASHGVLANTVSPGFVDTALTREVLGARGIEEISSRIPAQRLANPDEIAALVAWLASPDNSYASGQNFVIDGGFTRV